MTDDGNPVLDALLPVEVADAETVALLRASDPAGLDALARDHGTAVDDLVACLPMGTTTPVVVFAKAMRAHRGRRLPEVGLRWTLLLGAVPWKEGLTQPPEVEVARDWWDNLDDKGRDRAWNSIVDLRLPDVIAAPWRAALEEALDEEFVVALPGRDVRPLLAEAVLGPVGRAYVSPPLAVRLRQAVHPRGGLSASETVGLGLTGFGILLVVLALISFVLLVLRALF